VGHLYVNFGSSRLFPFLRYFSDKVSPAVHDAGAKKEGFGVWKEHFMHQTHLKKEEQQLALRRQVVEEKRVSQRS
jgi:hypothetical protein